MKKTVCLSLDVEVVDLLRTRAASLGVSQGALLGFSLRLALENLAPERLAAWAEHNRPRLGRPKGVERSATWFSTRERTVLDAFKGLLADGNGSWRFETAEVARRAGCWPSQVLQALYALEARGRVSKVDLKPNELDRWGRPSSLWWSLVESAPAAAAQTREGA
jgi:hypothetical protein